MEVHVKYVNKICAIAVIILTALALLIDCAFVYLKYFRKQPTTVSGAFIGNQVDPITGEELPLLQINCYSRNNGKGSQLIEYRLNGFSESTYQTIYGRGAQLAVDNNQWYKGFFETNDGNSWHSAQELNREYVLPIKINGDKYGIRLAPYRRVDRREINIWRGIRGIFTGKGLRQFIQIQTTNVDNTYGAFMSWCGEFARTQSNGYGDYYISAVDLGAYFDLLKYEDGKYKDVVTYDDNNQSMYYFSVGVHYDYRGCEFAKQSMFGSVFGDSNYNSSGIESVEYWRADSVTKLTKEDYTIRYSSEFGGNLISVNKEILTKKYAKDVQYDIDINIDDYDNLLGIDWYGFYGLNIDTLRITSSSNCTFKLMDNSLIDTDIDKFVKSDTVTLDISDNAYNGGYLL